MIVKSVVAVIAGVALTGSGLSAAQAAPAADRVSTSHVRTCSPYPATVITHTGLRVQKHRVDRGEKNHAFVHVRSVGAVDPKGTIRLRIAQKNGDLLLHREKRLQDGSAKLSLPRHIPHGRYSVRARYIAKDCSKWAESLSAHRHFRVTRVHV